MANTSKHISCGTYNGYQKHRRNKQTPCDACKKANAEWTAQYRRENPQIHKAIEQRYYAKHGERRRLEANERRAKNPEPHRQVAREWVLSHPEQIKAIKAAERERRRAAKDFPGWVKITLEMAISAHGSKCYLCNKELDFSITAKDNWAQSCQLDHVIPVSKGGLDHIDNVKPVHALCNAKKHSKVITLAE